MLHAAGTRRTRWKRSDGSEPIARTLHTYVHRGHLVSAHALRKSPVQPYRRDGATGFRKSGYFFQKVIS